jgi:hypothetical protein
MHGKQNIKMELFLHSQFFYGVVLNEAQGNFYLFALPLPT